MSVYHNRITDFHSCLIYDGNLSRVPSAWEAASWRSRSKRRKTTPCSRRQLYSSQRTGTSESEREYKRIAQVLFLYLTTQKHQTDWHSGDAPYSYSGDAWFESQLAQKKKVKKGRTIPFQALRVPGDWGSRISRKSVHDGGKVVSPTNRPPLPQEIFLVLISVRGWVNPKAIVRPEVLYQWKIPITKSGIEPATLRLVANCATAYPLSWHRQSKIRFFPESTWSISRRYSVQPFVQHSAHHSTLRSLRCWSRC